MLQRLGDGDGISLLELAGDTHGLEEVMHDPFVPISRFELPRLLLRGVVIVDHLVRMLQDFNEGGLEGVDAQFLVDCVWRWLRVRTVKQDPVGHEVDFRHLAPAPDDGALDYGRHILAQLTGGCLTQ